MKSSDDVPLKPVLYQDIKTISTSTKFKGKRTQQKAWDSQRSCSPSHPCQQTSFRTKFPRNSGPELSGPRNSGQHNIAWSPDTSPLFCFVSVTFLTVSHSPMKGSFISTQVKFLAYFSVKFSLHILNHK